MHVRLSFRIRYPNPEQYARISRKPDTIPHFRHYVFTCIGRRYPEIRLLRQEFFYKTGNSKSSLMHFHVVIAELCVQFRNTVPDAPECFL